MVIRRCRAVHPRLALQCEGEVTEQTVHLEDHWATDPADRTLRHSWQDEPLALPGVQSGRMGAMGRQVAGCHYQRAIQVWDIIEVWELDYWRGSVLKYLLRAGSKGPALEDLKKARHTLDRLIEIEEAGSGEA